MIRKLFLLICLPLLAGAQNHKYFVRFIDKSQTPYNISQPEQFLSQRAIDRRTRQNILITDQDLPVDPAYVSSVSATGAIVFTKSKWFNGITVECDSTVLNSIQQLPFVQSVSTVFMKAVSTTDKFFRLGSPVAPLSLLSTQYNYGLGYNQIHLMNGDYLHERGARGNGMLIAILDAGFYHVDVLDAFDSIRTHNRILATKDFVDNDSTVYDEATHGMNVLSCIAGNLPGDLVGTAPEASFLLLRTEDVATENIIEEYNWEAGAEYADSAGADLISSSLGYTEFDDHSMDHTYADMDGEHCPASIAGDIASSKGMIVITSAGNSGSSSWHYLGSPSDGDSVLSVGAVDEFGHAASFSSYGPASDGAVKPNVAAKGELSTVADAFNNVTYANGTSFSCPILAGSAACLWQAFPDKDAWTIKSFIEKSANYFSNPNDSLGYGIPNFRMAYDLLKYGVLPSSDNLVSVFPSPFKDNLTLNFYSLNNQNLRIDIFSATGQLVYSKEEVASEGYNLFSYGTAEVSSGIYLVRLEEESGTTFVTHTVKVP